ncbi:hypothetical protein [Streptomyces sp. NPDC096323]|uniref:hypothetical protein n=1 Tax=Streptomyces sp. NPDC096323 TaxID=3155822 RepID=UPI0033314A6E
MDGVSGSEQGMRGRGRLQPLWIDGQTVREAVASPAEIWGVEEASGPLQDVGCLVGTSDGHDPFGSDLVPVM